MQLSTYIQDLLYRYECVIIPGFGAFLTQYKSAVVETDSNLMYPPGKTVSFNKQLQTNDGLLAHYIASVDGSSYETALSKVRSFAGTISLKLASGETVILDNIGELELNSEKQIQFTPSENSNFSTASFGLAPFSAQTITRETQTSTATETPLLFEPRKRKTIPYGKYAAIGLIALAISGFAGMKIYESGVEKHNFAEKQKADTLVDRQIQEATFVIENPLPAVNLIVPKASGNYHIIAGAFRIEDNAYKKIDQLTEKGYTARYIGENRYGLHQVVYNSYEDRLEALQALRTIKRTENKDAWLLVQKLD